MTRSMAAIEKQVSEWSYVSGELRADPFNEVDLDVVVRHADGDSWRVPAYRAGEQEWRVRFCPPKAGLYEVGARFSEPIDLRGLLSASPDGENG